MSHPATIFDAVASHDLEGIMKEYLKVARTSVLGYLNYQERCRPRTEEVKNGELKRCSVSRNHVALVFLGFLRGATF
jgi:hypothetical protein